MVLVVKSLPASGDIRDTGSGDTDMENRLSQGWRRGGGAEMNGEASMESHTTICKQTASGRLLYNSGNSNQGSGITQRGGNGREMGGRLKREGTHVHLWLMPVDVCQKSNQYYKAIINQLKKKIFF